MRQIGRLLACLALSGCRAELPAELPPASTEQSSEASEPEVAPASTRVHVLALERSPVAGRLTEVVLDPRGEAALTLEASGEVRLWPTFGQAPWRLRLQAPIWMSFARRHASEGFTIGVIDTTNAAHVVELVFEDSTAGARLEPRFTIPPTEPSLELLVLDGGERVLLLGADHRLRLYDREGRLLSMLDERGFAPWQLRSSGGDGNEPLHLAVTLAAPLRIQRIELDGDQLRRTGQAWPIALDRGPNRNDLALTSDGRHAAALRRHAAEGNEWSVELVDLETGERKLIAGLLDTRVRARMHMLPGKAMLLESGSGRGYRVDLDRAVPLRRADDADPDGRFALKLARETEHPFVEIAAAAERPDQLPELDTGLRMHASMAGWVRAGFDAAGKLEITTLAEQP